jgi:predicted membrane protein
MCLQVCLVVLRAVLRAVLPLSLLLVMALLTDIRILLQVPESCLEGPQEELHLATRPQEEDH